MAKSKHLIIRIDPKVKKRLKDAKEARGVATTTDAVTEAIDLYSSFDLESWNMMQHVSRTVHRPLYLVMQNLVNSWLARELAQEKVYGRKGGVDYEFQTEKQEDRPGIDVVGKELLERLIALFTKEYEEQKRLEDMQAPGVNP